MPDLNEENDTSYATVSDSSERLIKLIARIEVSSQRVEIRISNIQKEVARNAVLFRAFEPIAEDLGFDSYSELRDKFVLLCNRVVRDVEGLDLKREDTRARWVEAVETASSVFNASNFGEHCSVVFKRHFSDIVLERLEAISERLQSDGIREASQPELTQALEAARESLRILEVNGSLPSAVSKVLKHYLQQIEIAFNQYSDFGEEMFWASYKEYFATFVQVHAIVMPSDVSDEAKSAVKDAVNKMHSKMVYGLPALGVAADVVSLGLAGYTLTQIAGF